MDKYLEIVNYYRGLGENVCVGVTNQNPGFLKAGSLTYYCCSPNFLIRIINAV